MGICQQKKKASQLRRESYPSDILSRNPNFIVGTIKLIDMGQLIIFNYLIHLDCLTGPVQMKFHESLDLNVNKLLISKTQGILRCDEKNLNEYFTALFTNIDDLEDVKNYQISINIVIRMKGKVYNVGIGDMKCLVFSVSSHGKLIITELVQPHILGRQDEAKRMSNKLLKDRKSKAYTNNSNENKANLNSNYFKPVQGSDHYFNVTRSLGYGKVTRAQLGIISSAEVVAINYNSEIKLIGIFSSLLLRIMSSYEIAYHLNKYLLLDDLKSFSASIIEHGHQVLSAKLTNSSSKVIGRSIENYTNNPAATSKTLRSIEGSQIFCTAIQT